MGTEPRSTDPLDFFNRLKIVMNPFRIKYFSLFLIAECSENFLSLG